MQSLSPTCPHCQIGVFVVIVAFLVFTKSLQKQPINRSHSSLIKKGSLLRLEALDNKREVTSKAKEVI